MRHDAVLKRLTILVLTASLIAGFVVLPGEAEAARSRRIVISEEDAARIKGKIMRPELSLILQRSKINYDALKLKESFLPRIVRSVQQDPF
ncbi:MAG: hypothetical protein C4523_21345 [Myxococcales bacterium]|nr:MAG: hypothetical protein C4523_21345 [Myxococcales bacterium]